MQLILSRKGFDAGWGGRPSPILPDGRLVSIPIPEPRPATGGVPYTRLRVAGEATSHARLLRRLGVQAVRYPAAAYRGERDRTVVRVPLERARAHLDPDLRADTTERAPAWRPAFGQSGGAQRHLAGRGVGPGDVFLFFGWFRGTRAAPGGRLRYDGPDLHVLWGWLEIDEVLGVTAETDLGWAHPHLAGRHLRRYARHNTLYLAREQLSLDPRLPGAGTFPAFHPRLQLSAHGATRRVWDLPAAFHPGQTPQPLSWHGPRRWRRDGDRVLLDTVRGQEFVVGATPPIESWLRERLAAAVPD
jgi:hypothetical protein